VNGSGRGSRCGSAGWLSARAWAADAAVARDGATHRVQVEGAGESYAIWSDQSLIDPVCTLTGDDGAPIEATPVPRDERVFLEERWVAVPEASSTFRAPVTAWWS
jgi:hypothetical protein